MTTLATNLYTKETVAVLDKPAIASGIPGYTLMRRAGAALLACLNKNFSRQQKLLIVCGAGNNAGDGYVLARLAKQQGWQLTVATVVELTQLKADVLQACQHWQEVGAVVAFDDVNASDLLDDCDIIVDALLGTGLSRDVAGKWLRCIDAINQAAKHTISVDIPSGLNANTGCIQAAAINADYTVSFIGLKQGMFTASGKQCCGEILFDDLSVAAEIVQHQQPSARLMTLAEMADLPSRRHDSHKANFGHVLVVGGNHNMPGAVALTARAALKAGAGLVTVVTLPEHVAAITGVCPEAMVHATATGQIDDALLGQVTHGLIGPGLGQDAWANRLLYQLMQLSLPVLYDADALNLIARSQQIPSNACVITPDQTPDERNLHVWTGEYY